jgi:hypothetical protein
MKLLELRKVTVKKKIRIRFVLANGLECVLNEHGVAQVPALHATPEFNLEEELARVQEFVVEPADIGPQEKSKPRRCTRDEMAALAAEGGAAAVAAEHDE